jgi:hypothetical protein
MQKDPFFLIFSPTGRGYQNDPLGVSNLKRGGIWELSEGYVKFERGGKWKTHGSQELKKNYVALKDNTFLHFPSGLLEPNPRWGKNPRKTWISNFSPLVFFSDVWLEVFALGQGSGKLWKLKKRTSLWKKGVEGKLSLSLPPFFWFESMSMSWTKTKAHQRGEEEASEQRKKEGRASSNIQLVS